MIIQLFIIFILVHETTCVFLLKQLTRLRLGYYSPIFTSHQSGVSTLKTYFSTTYVKMSFHFTKFPFSNKMWKLNSKLNRNTLLHLFCATIKCPYLLQYPLVNETARKISIGHREQNFLAIFFQDTFQSFLFNGNFLSSINCWTV